MSLSDIWNINAGWLDKHWWHYRCSHGKHDRAMKLALDGNIHGRCWRCGDDVVMTSINKQKALELYERLLRKGGVMRDFEGQTRVMYLASKLLDKHWEDDALNIIEAVIEDRYSHVPNEDKGYMILAIQTD